MRSAVFVTIEHAHTFCVSNTIPATAASSRFHLAGFPSANNQHLGNCLAVISRLPTRETLHCTHTLSIRLRFAMQGQQVSQHIVCRVPTVRSSIPYTRNLFQRLNYSHQACSTPSPWKSVGEFKSTCGWQCAGTDCEADNVLALFDKTEVKPRPPVSWQ